MSLSQDNNSLGIHKTLYSVPMWPPCEPYSSLVRWGWSSMRVAKQRLGESHSHLAAGPPSASRPPASLLCSLSAAAVRPQGLG